MHDNELIQISAADKRITEFLKNLSSARSRALLLDYDGTLAPFDPSPEEAYPYSEIPSLLHLIRFETDTRLVIVSGRRAADIPRLLNLRSIEVWGCHGLERVRVDGSTEFAQIDARILSLIETARKLIESEGLTSCAEYKTASIAVHWRGRESIAEHVLRRMRRIWSMLPDRDGLRLAPFNGGIEIRPIRNDKGDIVRAILNEMGPDVAMAYLGDDETDEDAFGALTHRGLNILVRDEYRPTLADAWIKPPDVLLEFLRGWLAACRVDGDRDNGVEGEELDRKSTNYETRRG